jgi:PncC family amidohydrolase
MSSVGSGPEVRGSAELANAIIREMAARALTLGLAESCTGGLISKELTDPAGASAVFSGAIVAYANAVKIGILGVGTETIERYGAVSAEAAREMASGALRLLGTDIALSITGIAGPAGGSAEKPVGTVWIGIADGDRVEAYLHRFDGDRAEIRERAAAAALALLWRDLQKRQA